MLLSAKMINVLLVSAIAILWAVVAILGAGVLSDRRWHKTAIVMAAVIGVALTAWQALRAYDAQSQGQKEQRLLRSQIQDLVKALISTSKNVSQLAKAHVPSSKEQKPSIPSTTLPTQRVARIRYEERQSPSSVDWAPHSLQVIIRTDVPIENAGFKIECSGVIHNGRFSVVGHVVMKNVRQEIIGGTTFSFKFDSPAFTPDSPIIVSLLAKSAIRVNRIEQW